MGLRDKWIDIIYRWATTSSKARTILTPIGQIFFFILVGLFVVASLKVDELLGYSRLFLIPFNFIISFPIIGIGLFLSVWSIVNFARVKGTPVPINPPPKLVNTGPYAYVRNPMMFGLFIILFGIGVLLGSVSLIIIFTPLFILINVLELKMIEEPELERRLGNEYLEYKKEVPMFIPRWKRDRLKG
ncbi:MAG: isoprenylcysteine carboxylmethyltransferase family protein [Deltaproteobacteria bacterium]|nr:MAG: isoprenylcysteine carboxylmethyltransferase family protein [Deltaproteobacteria bacterium]